MNPAWVGLLRINSEDIVHHADDECRMSKSESIPQMGHMADFRTPAVRARDYGGPSLAWRLVAVAGGGDTETRLRDNRMNDHRGTISLPCVAPPGLRDSFWASIPHAEARG